MIDIPEYVRQGLISAYHNIAIDPEWQGYPVWDEKVNRWLTGRFGLQTDSPEYDINWSFKVHFDWRLQIWYVK